MTMIDTTNMTVEELDAEIARLEAKLAEPQPTLLELVRASLASALPKED